MKLNIWNIVDVETCCSKSASFPEIVEIGVVEVNLDSKEIVKACSYLVKPIFNVLSKCCTEFHGWDQGDVENCPDLRKVSIKLEEDFRSQNRPWASFGTHDYDAFKENAEMLDIKSSFLNPHVNICPLIAMKMGFNETKDLEELMLPHKAIDSAYNTAKLFLKLF